MDHLLSEACCCPITFERMKDPVIGLDGHSYERSAIVKALSRDPRCPTTRKAMQISDLRPNRALKEIITALDNGPDQSNKRARKTIREEPLPATPRPLWSSSAQTPQTAHSTDHRDRQNSEATMLCPAETNWILRDGPIPGWHLDTHIRVDGRGSTNVCPHQAEPIRRRVHCFF